MLRSWHQLLLLYLTPSERFINTGWLILPKQPGEGAGRIFRSSLPPPFCKRKWEVGSCTYYLRMTEARSGPGCVHLMPWEMGWGTLAKRGTGEDHGLGSGERFISSTPHCCSFYIQSEMSWSQMLSWCKSVEHRRFIPAGELDPVPQWEGDGGKGEREAVS